MKYFLIGIISIAFASGTHAQSQNFKSITEQAIDLGEVSAVSEDFTGYEALDELLADVDIFMLGEQSHGEGTTYATKIKLIKYLHQKLGFDLLVFESGFYDAHKAWNLIDDGVDVREAMGNSISFVWSTSKELMPLAEYLENTKLKQPLKLLGFDCQFYTNYSKKYLLSDLSNYLETIDKDIIASNNWKHLKTNLALTFENETKKLKRNHPEQDTSYVNFLVQKLSDLPSNAHLAFWIQVLKNIKVHLDDYAFGIDQRDKQMADNLRWLREKYPSKKIICWGATSHFLYNSTEIRMKRPFIQLFYGKYFKKQPMMGDYVKEMYGDKVFTIGFTAYQGYYGLDRKKKIKPAKKGSFEHLLSQTGYENYLLPLKGFDFKNHNARPLGNQYMKNDIARHMDAVIFNRTMRPTNTDFHFYLMIYPENKYIKL